MLAVACAGSWPSPDAAHCGVELVATEDLPPDLRLRASARFRAREGAREIHLELIAHGTRDELVLVGLAPYGSRLFALRQRGYDVSIEQVARGLAPLPWWALDALHRSLWIAAPADETRWERSGELVREWREAGRRQREFVRAAQPASVPITIQYPQAGFGSSDDGVELRNPHCGYEAVIVLLEAGETG